MEQAAEESRYEERRHEHPVASAPAGERPSVPELVRRVVPGIFFIPLAGPPVFLLLGPWLILVLLIIPPAALLITLALIVAAAGGVVFALGAVIASPYLIVRHLHARHEAREAEPAERRRFAFAYRHLLPKGTS
jgi:hypothetical protein